MLKLREVAGNGKDPARLLLETGTDQGGPGERPFVGVVQFLDIGRNAIQEPQIFRGEGTDPASLETVPLTWFVIALFGVATQSVISA